MAIEYEVLGTGNFLEKAIFFSLEDATEAATAYSHKDGVTTVTRPALYGGELNIAYAVRGTGDYVEKAAFNSLSDALRVALLYARTTHKDSELQIEFLNKKTQNTIALKGVSYIVSVERLSPKHKSGVGSKSKAEELAQGILQEYQGRVHGISIDSQRSCYMSGETISFQNKNRYVPASLADRSSISSCLSMDVKELYKLGIVTDFGIREYSGFGGICEEPYDGSEDQALGYADTFFEKNPVCFNVVEDGSVVSVSFNTWDISYNVIEETVQHKVTTYRGAMIQEKCYEDSLGSDDNTSKVQCSITACVE